MSDRWLWGIDTGKNRINIDRLLRDPPPHTCEGRAEYCTACWVDEIKRLVKEVGENEQRP
uniref:Uncharacterized protein n=1 Tax=viral metagenome TaxID=1070528 RepID=A0A6M3LHT0_9ZZZZ